MKTRTMTLAAVMTALLCMTGPLTVPLGPVPLSLTTAVLMAMALLLGARHAALCCGLYLLIGLCGVPVFSGFTGGLAALAGPTGGFLLGYLPLTALCGSMFSRWDRRIGQAFACLAGTVLLYLCGVSWYAGQTGCGIPAALTVCVLPFLPGDMIKIILVLTGGNAIKTRLHRAGLL